MAAENAEIDVHDPNDKKVYACKEKGCSFSGIFFDWKSHNDGNCLMKSLRTKKKLKWGGNAKGRGGKGKKHPAGGRVGNKR